MVPRNIIECPGEHRFFQLQLSLSQLPEGVISVLACERCGHCTRILKPPPEPIDGSLRVQAGKE
jgi:hypothetical protein